MSLKFKIEIYIHGTSECNYQIFMSFSSPVVGCLLKKGSQKGGGGGGGVTGTPGPPLATPLIAF